MEQYSYPPQVTEVPLPEEKTAIRKYYTKVAIVLFADMVLLNAAALAIRLLKNTAVFGRAWENEFFREVFSCGIPIISEAVAIIIGIKLLGIKFMPLLRRDNYDGGTVTKLVFLSLGLQSVMSAAVLAIETVLNFAGVSVQGGRLSVNTSLPANIVFYLYACVIGPILEEMLYRGVVLQSLRKYNERFAIFFSALIFGLMHQNYQQFLAAFVFGIPLAVIAVKYNSILPTIIAHIICNTSAALVQVIVQSICPEYFSSDMFNLNPGALPAAFWVIAFASLIFRFAVSAAALVIGIYALVKGGYIRRPSPAGKNRALPVIAASPLWWIVFVSYVLLCMAPLAAGIVKSLF